MKNEKLIVSGAGDTRHTCAPSPSLHFVSFGAGDRNRTDAISLEGWSSTIELHPQTNYYNTFVLDLQTNY